MDSLLGDKYLEVDKTNDIPDISFQKKITYIKVLLDKVDRLRNNTNET